MAAGFRRIGAEFSEVLRSSRDRDYVSFVHVCARSGVRKTLKIGLGAVNIEKLCLFLRPSDTTIW